MLGSAGLSGIETQGSRVTIGAMTPGFVTSAVLGETGVLYDLDKTIYLGSPDGAAQWVFGTRMGVGGNNLENSARCRGCGSAPTLWVILSI